MRRLILIFLSAILLVAVVPSSLAFSAEPKNRGLYISPLRNYLTIKSGESVTRAFRVANLTDKPMNVTVSIEEFSVSDYAYDFSFSAPDNKWLSFVEPRFTLKPNESREVPYRLTVPKDAPVGGQYYTLFASADLSEGGLDGTVRAATLLYLTIDGTLQRTSKIQTSALFPIVLSSQIPYTMDVKNTGNIHYFAYFAAKVDGLFYHNAPNGVSQLLMPGATRHIESSVASPLIPGVYKVTYGYKPDQGDEVSRSQYILFIPPWFIVLLAILSVILVKLFARRRNAQTVTHS